MVTRATSAVPAPARHELRRERLLELLHRHGTRPLILLVAPAGFGKSTLAAAYARESGAVVAWFTLRAGDCDSRVFFSGLCDALEAAFGDKNLLPNTRRGMIEGAAGTGLARILLADLAQPPAGFILVLDDYHAVQPADEVHQAVDVLVRGLPDVGQIVITAREPPPVSMEGLVVKDGVFVLGAEDLRFTPDETVALRHTLGGNPAGDARADGWVAGILLGGAPRQLGATGGSLLGAYVEREVLDRLRPVDRRWLEMLAVLQTITPAAARRLIGPGPWLARLARLAVRCPFLIGDEDGHYHLHALLQEALLARLRRRSAARADRAWVIARALAEEAHDTAGAVRACQELGQADDAADMVRRTVEEALRTGRWPSALATLTLLPESERRARPYLSLAEAHALVQSGRPEPARRTAEAALEHGGRWDDVAVQVSAMLELANIARYTGDLDAAQDWLAGADHMLLAADRDLCQRRVLEGRLLGLRGVCLAIRGQTTEAREAFEAAERVLQLDGTSRELAVVQNNLGAFCIRAGDYRAGQAALASSSRHWRLVGDRVNLATTQLLLGNLYLRLGDLDTAGATLARVIEAARAAGVPRIEGHAMASLGVWHRANGRIGDAAATFDASIRLAEEVGERELLVRALRHRAEIAVLQHDVRTARHLVARAQVEGQQLGSSVEMLGVERALGRLHLVDGENQRAMNHLEAALRGGEVVWEPDERAITLYWIGTAYLVLGQSHRAEAALREALEQAGASVGLALLAGPAAEDAHLLRYGLQIGVDPSALRTLERLAVRRTPWTGVQKPTLELVARNDFPRLEVRLFGTFFLHRDGTLVEPGAKRDRARELFALLLLHPNGRPGREIAELLWSEMAPERALHNLRMTAYLLRRFLGTKAAVRHATLTYRLAPQVELWVDARAFEAALSQARGATGAAVVRALENALDLYRGPLLGDTGWPWVEPFRLAYQSQAARAALRLAELLAPSDLTRSSAVAERALAIEPSNEAAYERLIRNAQTRRDPGALRDAIRRYRDMARDLGMPPNPTLLRAI